ncbi:MAG TPA: bifunctional DNA-formamidopyrimidine glycosylase/DNA-(apurinic or apyrimidinic site) lyase [Aeromicrobium sp.]|nr:bifunctional DNA-formamidopyrimidine glycosylase/DNA-(apurinic or apyrimidinic site) lyase [Aeromicrobium sp.]
MPELPEVEVVRRGIVEHAVGAAIDKATVYDGRSVRRHLGGPTDFEDRLVGRTVAGVGRRGKYLWLRLDNDDAVLTHLGMSGQVLIQRPDLVAQKHLRIVFDLDNGRQLRFVDQRIFGGMLVSDGGADLPAEIAHIARDPSDPAFDVDLFAERLKRRRTGIKRALLDQGLVSGIGNIYADEALWLAKLHYARATDTMRKSEVIGLLNVIRDVFTSALSQGGTSFDALYVNVNGESGYFDRSLEAYGQEGLPCSRCGTPIRRDSFMNRSSYTCPACQPRPRNGRW